MKKLFTCIALIACSVIGMTQVNNLPSFRNYQNNIKSSPLYQPPRVLNLPVKNGMPIVAMPNGNILKRYDLTKAISKEKDAALLSESLASIMPNGNKLYLLPQDNMPCIVPARSQFAMPVVKGNNELDKKINVSTP